MYVYANMLAYRWNPFIRSEVTKLILDAGLYQMKADLEQMRIRVFDTARCNNVGSMESKVQRASTCSWLVISLNVSGSAFPYTFPPMLPNCT